MPLPLDLAAIRQRVDSPQSLGYSFTHYQQRQDVRALLAALEAALKVVEAAEATLRGMKNEGYNDASLSQALTAFRATVGG